MTKNLKLLILLTFCIGLFIRAYLAFNLPAWGDEVYSIWTTTRHFSEIITGSTDPVHPPGYYLILKIFSQISDHLFWLRTLSLLAFITNCLFIYRLGKNVYSSHVASIWIVLYSLSGYFLVFDWQVRMYSPCLTLILISLLLFERYKKYPQLIIFTFFTGINALGLYMDYAYVWYFIPMLFIISIKSIRNEKYLTLGYSLVISLCLFFVLYPQFFVLAPNGINGISWVEPFTNPLFFIPYFLGNIVPYPIMAWLMGTTIIAAIIFSRKYLKEVPVFMILCSIFSSTITLLVSYFFLPLFHVRSLQIVPLTLIVLSGIGYAFIPRKYYWIYVPIYSLNLAVFILSFVTIISNPGSALLRFYPWKKIISENRLDQYSTVLYRQNEHPFSPMLAFGLDYSLSGKDRLPATNISHSEIQGNPTNQHCSLVYESFLSIYGCNNNQNSK